VHGFSRAEIETISFGALEIVEKAIFYRDC
jgi:hypothetical protein